MDSLKQLRESVSGKLHELFHKCEGKLSTDEFNPISSVINEPRCEKTGFLHMRKQRRRSASR